MVIGLMGYFEEAVDLAIEKEELELAKSYANKPNDEKQKKHVPNNTLNLGEKKVHF